MAEPHKSLPDQPFDEEQLGFEEPPGLPGKRLSPAEQSALACVAIGALLMVLAKPGTWGWFLASFGPICLGGALFVWLRYRGRVPGIRHDGIFFSSLLSRGVLGWLLSLVFTGFYVALYWRKSMLDRLVTLVDPLAMLIRRSHADSSFLYSFLYTTAVLVFGVRMLVKYRGNRYQLLRTGVVMAVQLVFAFLIPQLMRAIDEPEFYFSYFWPLQPNYLFPSDLMTLIAHPTKFGVFLAGWGILMSFAAVPILTYFYGKRWYCSWVCGCGGLAETMGDPFRQLSSKSSRAWKLERWSIHLVLVLIVVVTAALWLDFTTGALGGFSEKLRSFYKVAIILVFGGVVGVGFYPLFGGRVWCRFGCPQAAILGILQRTFSRFRITTNGGQCMSCGNCSTYCEMGIDVRAYAQRKANIVRASCVGCGVCAAVCPRGVLKLENGPTHADRFPNADRPFAALHDMLSPPRPQDTGKGARTRAEAKAE